MPTPSPSPSNPSQSQNAAEGLCTHPRVRVVAREEDTEFVECEDCRAVFEASEFEDMAIEEKNPPCDS